VIVHIDELASEALCEESRDEQRHVTESSQCFVAFVWGWRFGRFGKHVRERPESNAFGGLFVQLFGAREHGQYVYDVVLGLLVHCDALLPQRGLDRIMKELAKIGDREQRLILYCILHYSTPRSLQIHIRL
jgi:hypothetical protein